MLKQFLLIVPILVVVGCKPPTGTVVDVEENKTPLSEARRGFTTKLAAAYKSRDGMPKPPVNPHLFDIVQYESSAGKLQAYLMPDPKNGKKNPAIIWINGGDCNSIGDVWTKATDPARDESARQYRKAGIIMMYPALRGGNNNPGFQENFYGEVDDVLAAADYLAKLDYVDPKRIYLGGHSTGGTLVLLASEMTDRFRSVFSFGPVSTITGYPGQYTKAVNFSDKKEVELRSPGYWLYSIKSPTFVFEGTRDGNLDALEQMQKKTKNPKIQFFPVKGGDHFSILAPLNTMIAQRILLDTGEEPNIFFTDTDMMRAMSK